MVFLYEIGKLSETYTSLYQRTIRSVFRSDRVIVSFSFIRLKGSVAKFDNRGDVSLFDSALLHP